MTNAAFKKMGPKKGRKNVRKLEIPASDIQRTREEREQRGRGRRQRTNSGWRLVREREEARRKGTPQSHTEEGVAEKRPKTETIDSAIDTEAGGEAGTSQL